jgi:hypothetical protein
MMKLVEKMTLKDINDNLLKLASPPPRRREKASPPTGERRILSAIEVSLRRAAWLI